jgi:hypothetical protein
VAVTHREQVSRACWPYAVRPPPGRPALQSRWSAGSPYAGRARWGAAVVSGGSANAPTSGRAIEHSSRCCCTRKQRTRVIATITLASQRSDVCDRSASAHGDPGSTAISAPARDSKGLAASRERPPRWPRTAGQPPLRCGPGCTSSLPISTANPRSDPGVRRYCLGDAVEPSGAQGVDRPW